jgi:TetR/AcrR family transcriptional regulator, transcriptional repressor for nem operon
MQTPSPTQSRKERSHERILDVAARALRRAGAEGVGVAEVMREAGLTHGGFYAHFRSREAMVAAAIERAGRNSADHLAPRIAKREAEGAGPLRALLESYLADSQLAAAETGCPVAALGSEMARQTPLVREASCDRVRNLIRLVAQRLPADVAADRAAPIVSAMVGAVQLARALGNNAEGRALLHATRDALIAQYAEPA